MHACGKILLVDDQLDYIRGLARLLEGHPSGCECLLASDASGALEILGRERVCLMLSDLRMPGMDGLQLLQHALAREPELSVVIITGYGNIETAVEAVKAGAYDFITKPVDKESLFKVVSKGLERSHLLGENRVLRQKVAESELGKVLIGESQTMQHLRESIRAVAASDYTVLITGESGTGKELVARTIHNLSSRSDRPMLGVNCPAIPDELLESELFGHAKGAFSGADRQRKGIFVSAEGSTLLLDEIGDISHNIQTKLLRVLQEHEVRPVGTNHAIPVDVRIIASTNQDLEAKLQDGSFRDDLFYRLNVLHLQAPPLRNRSDDIPLLARHFLTNSCREMNLPDKDIAPEVLSFLASRAWPGNVRELQNFMRRLAVFAPSQVLDMPQVYMAENAMRQPDQEQATQLPYKEAKARVVDDFTNTYVRELLRNTGGNVSEAARHSGLERVSLQKILKRLGIKAEEFRTHPARPDDTEPKR